MSDEKLPEHPLLESLKDIFKKADEAEAHAILITALALTARPPLSEAPELYVNRPRVGGSREHVVDFIRRVYGDWLPDRISKADLRRLDSHLYRAYWNWANRNDLPDDLKIPSKKQHLDTLIENFIQGVPESEHSAIWEHVAGLRRLVDRARSKLG